MLDYVGHIEVTFGIFAVARSTHAPEAVRYWLGSTLLAQAGAAIALSAVAAQRDPELGKQIQTIPLPRPWQCSAIRSRTACRSSIPNRPTH